MNAKQKKSLAAIIISIVLFIAALLCTNMFTVPSWCEFLIFAGIYLICGFSPLRKAVINISHGQVFDENFLMCIATIGAFAIGEYHEAVEVIVFYRVGELFESIAVGRSRKAVSELMDICPEEAVVLRDGNTVTEAVEDVNVGEHIIVAAGNRIPLDGVVVKGQGGVDASALTGESLPLEVLEGSQVLSGCINMSGTLEIEVTKLSCESQAAKILELVEEASERKAKTESFITRFAKYYTPAVVIGALLLSVIPPLFTGYNFSEWIFRGLTFLIVSCPCALVISVPLSFFSGIGCASKHGILIKGSSFMEVLSKTKIAAADKTGTLTKGTFSVSSVYGENKSELLRLTAYAESSSSHPIARSICRKYGDEIDYSLITNQSEKAAFGVEADVEGRHVIAGKKSFLEQQGIECAEEAVIGTAVHTAVDGKYLGYIIVSDSIKNDAKDALSKLRSCGCEKVVMLTGDRRETAEAVGRELGLDEVYSELLPGDKLELMRNLRRECNSRGRLVYIGDGMNDAPVLAEADVGVAMGGLGSDAAIEAADVIIMDDKPSKLALGIKISRRTMGIAKQNIVFALTVKALVLGLSAAGLTGMELAVFADVGVSVIAILNAMRASKI